MRTFGYLTVASPLHDMATVERVTAGVRDRLDAAGGARVTRPEDAPDAPLAILVATGGTEAAIIEAVHRRVATVAYEPVVLVAHPLHNSLPAALEALARVRRDGSHGRIVQMSRDTGASQLVAAVVDATAVHRLHRTRIGLVGPPSPWLVASVPDAALLRARWGVELVPIDIGHTIDAYQHTDPVRVRSATTRLVGSAAASDTLVSAARVHPVLVDAMGDAHVDAVAVRCFDYLDALHTSGCVALAELNDAGVVAGCEGDVASTMAMLLVKLLVGHPSWMANPASIDEERDQVLLAHCTVAPSLVQDVELLTHFESGIGVGLRGRFAPGPVTLMRLGGDALERCWMAEGELIRAGDADDVCRTQVVVQLAEGATAPLLDDPLGNHLVMFHGHHRRRFERWWRLAFGSV